MEINITLLIALLVGILAGIAIASFINRSARTSAAENATLKAQAESQASISQLSEQLAVLRAEVGEKIAIAEMHRSSAAQKAGEVDTLRSELSKKIQSLIELATQCSTLQEQSTRIPALMAEIEELKSLATTLQSELASSNQRKATLEQEVLCIPSLQNELNECKAVLANVHTEKTELLTEAAELKTRVEASTKLLTDKISQIEANERELASVRIDLSNRTQTITELSGQCASLQEQASRIPALQQDIMALRTHNGSLQQELAASNERKAGLEQENLQIASLTNEINQHKTAYAKAQGELIQLVSEVTELKTHLANEKTAAEEKIALLEGARHSMSEHFKNVANDILEEKSRKFTEQNQVQLGSLLDPLKQQITEFKGKVEDSYIKETQERSAMVMQVKQLMELNQNLSTEARNLTNALKGNVKAQGNWGEIILERVLESSGLRKDHEYSVQESTVREDGTRAQPDVIIKLPEDRKLIVDSKVSLGAYDQYASAETEDARGQALQRHIDSIRNHVRGLSGKGYEKLYGQGLDFVLMFVPIEPAFMLAIANDEKLFMDAWQRNVLLVSPSTLLFVVRTVAHLWRQEQQSRNAQEIAKRGAELHDKLADFLKDLEAVGNRIAQARESYDDAHKRLATGRGNVIRQAQMLAELGVKANKKLPASITDTASLAEDAFKRENASSPDPQSATADNKVLSVGSDLTDASQADTVQALKSQKLA